MKGIKRFFGILFSLYGFAVFVLVMFLLFPFVVIASFFGKHKGGNMIYEICRLWADIVLFCWGIRHQNIFEANPAIDHPVVYVFNHISYIDIPFMMKAFRKHHVRILGKAEMSKIPVFGFIYRNAVVMVNRQSDAARVKSVQQLKKVLAKNISVVIAPEGTFNMTHQPLKEFYNGAFRIAVEMQIPVQPVLFLDGYDRLHYNNIFSLNPGRSRAVFLPELAPGTDMETLKEKVYREMETALIRYKASWIKNQ